MSELLLSLHSVGSIESRDNDVLPLDHTNSKNDSHEPHQLSTPPLGVTKTLSRVSLAKLASKIKTNQSTSSRKSNIVPKLERRGILAFLTVVPEYEDARDYPKTTKLFIVFIIAFAAITGPMGTSIMLPAIQDVADSLDTTTTVVNVSVGIYLISLGIFPLWWSALSETLGRRTIYVISFSLFLAFSIGSALSPSIGALIAFRVLCGGCSASVQAVGAGTIGDLFIPEDRGMAMGLYYLGPLMGPFLAPILGGFVAQAWGWRATQWLMVIFSGCNVIFILFALPETLRKQDNVAAIKDLLRKQLEEENDDYEVEEKEEREKEEMGIPANITNTPGVHDFTDTELERIANNLSRSLSRRSQHSFQIQQFHGDEEEPVLDAVMPSLSRLTTNKSSYSRRLTQQQENHDLEAAILEAAKDIDEKQYIDGQPEGEREQENIIPLKVKLYNYIIRPLHSLVLLSHPPVALVISFSAISFCCIYFFNMTISYAYGRPPYGFSSNIIGLLYIPNSVTYVIASIIGGRWNDRLLKRYADTHNGELNPESRLSWNLVVAVACFPPAMLIFGWCLQYGEHWVTPLIGTAFYGFACMLVIGATVTYLVDTLPGKGATGVALNNFVRMILAAIATFVVEPALKGIGPGKLFSILLAAVTASSGAVLILKWKGEYFRKNYDLSKLYDKL